MIRESDMSALNEPRWCQIAQVVHRLPVRPSIFTPWYVFRFSYPQKRPVYHVSLRISWKHVVCQAKWLLIWVGVSSVRDLLVCLSGVYKNRLFTACQTSIRDEAHPIGSYRRLLIGSHGQIGRSPRSTQMWNGSPTTYGSHAMGWRWRWELICDQRLKLRSKSWSYHLKIMQLLLRIGWRRCKGEDGRIR